MAKLKTVMEIATCTNASWSNRQKATFHAFNPNGLVAEMKRLSDTIKEIVGNDPVPFCCYYTREEYKLYIMCAQPAVKRSDLWLAIWGLERRIKEARAFIEEAQTAA